VDCGGRGWRWWWDSLALAVLAKEVGADVTEKTAEEQTETGGVGGSLGPFLSHSTSF